MYRVGKVWKDTAWRISMYRVFAERLNLASLAVIKTWSFNKFIYFRKSTYVYIMCGVTTATQDLFFSADDGCVSAVRAGGRRVRGFCRSAKTLYNLRIYITYFITGIGISARTSRSNAENSSFTERFRVQILVQSPAILTVVFWVVFLCSSGQVLRYHVKLSNDHLLPHPFTSIIY